MAKPKRDKDREANFEQDLEQLETIVNALEEGGLSLDDSLKRFEEGIQLARRCERALTDAEKRIEILLKNADGDLEAQPFGDDAPPAPAPARAAAARPTHNDDDDDAPLHEPDEEEEEDSSLLF